MWGWVQLYIYVTSTWRSGSSSEDKIYPCPRVCPVSNVKGRLCLRSCIVLTNGSFSGWEKVALSVPLSVWDVNTDTLSPLPTVRPLAACMWTTLQQGDSGPTSPLHQTWSEYILPLPNYFLIFFNLLLLCCSINVYFDFLLFLDCLTLSIWLNLWCSYTGVIQWQRMEINRKMCW